MGLWIISTLCAFFVKGMCGFADTLVLTTMLSFGINNVAISPVALLLAYPSNALIAWRERKNIDWKLCFPLIAMVALGCVPGILLLKAADAGLLKLFFGVLVVILGVEMFFRDKNAGKGKENKYVMAGIGVLCGVICGVYGIGAVLSAYMSRVKKDPGAFKGNLCAVFFAENTIRVILYSAAGILTLAQFTQALLLLPVVLLGLWAGLAGSRRLSEKIVRKLTVVLLIFSGVSLIAGQLPI